MDVTLAPLYRHTAGLTQLLSSFLAGWGLTLEQWVLEKAVPFLGPLGEAEMTVIKKRMN